MEPTGARGLSEGPICPPCIVTSRRIYLAANIDSAVMNLPPAVRGIEAMRSKASETSWPRIAENLLRISSRVSRPGSYSESDELTISRVWLK